jgi:sugar phosphate isomerase/epimerase
VLVLHPPPRLAVTPALLRASTLAARVEHANRLGVGLELPCTTFEELDAQRAARLLTLQASGLHTAHALCADPLLRARGIAHLLEALEFSARLGIPRVLAVCGFGASDPATAFAHSLAQFRAVTPRARALGVRIVIERLGAARTNAMLEPDEHARLHAELAAPDVYGAALDTGHMLDAGEDPQRVIAAWPLPIEELQLRGRGGTPPALDAPFEAWALALRAIPSVVCIETRTAAPSSTELAVLLARVRAAFGSADSTGPTR